MSNEGEDRRHSDEGCCISSGHGSPLTPANDIAPDIKMVTRKDLPIPAVDSYLYRSTSVWEMKKEIPAVSVGVKQEIPTVPYRSGQSNRRPVEVKMGIPAVPYRSGQSNR